jgi:hypothetical protein
MEAKRGMHGSASKQSMDTSMQLYEDSKFIEQRRKALKQSNQPKFTFKPNINKKSDTVVRLLGKNFYERMENYNKNKAVKLSKTTIYFKAR